MNSRTQQSFDRAQARRDSALPSWCHDEPVKDCPTCDGLGRVRAAKEDLSLWGRIVNFFDPLWLICPECRGECELFMTESEIADLRDDAAMDRAKDESLNL